MSKRIDHRVLITLLTLALVAPTLTTQAASDPCDVALPFVVDAAAEAAIFQGRAYGASSEIVEIHVPDGGFLNLEAIGAMGTVPVRLTLAACHTPAAVRTQEAPAALRLRLRDAGRAVVEIAPQDPSATLSEYALHALFTPQPNGPLVAPRPATLRTKVEPIEDDEESGLTGGTPLPFGVAISGEIANSGGVDVDHYVFTLPAQTSVGIDVAGTSGIAAILFDEAGQQLENWTGSRVRTLVAGSYRLRVGSTATWGEYSVTLTTP